MDTHIAHEHSRAKNTRTNQWYDPMGTPCAPGKHDQAKGDNGHADLHEWKSKLGCRGGRACSLFLACEGRGERPVHESGRDDDSEKTADSSTEIGEASGSVCPTIRIEAVFLSRAK